MTSSTVPLSESKGWESELVGLDSPVNDVERMQVLEVRSSGMRSITPLSQTSEERVPDTIPSMRQLTYSALETPPVTEVFAQVCEGHLTDIRRQVIARSSRLLVEHKKAYQLLA